MHCRIQCFPGSFKALILGQLPQPSMQPLAEIGRAARGELLKPAYGVLVRLFVRYTRARAAARVDLAGCARPELFGPRILSAGFQGIQLFQHLLGLECALVRRKRAGDQ